MAQEKDVKFICGDAYVREIKDEATGESLANTLGHGCTELHEPLVKFDSAECEVVIPSIDGHKGSYIVFGRDRPTHADPASPGYGNQGHTRSAMIDLVVGRNVAGPKNEIVPCGPPDPEDPANSDLPEQQGLMVAQEVPPNFTRDAARIYISQKSDIDHYFELAGGTVGRPTGKSAVALKADGVRILAREGIKLICGLDEYNSRSVPNSGAKGINLIYGNKTDGPDYELHPMVRGRNLKEGLNSMADMIGILSGMIADISMALISLAGDYGAHMHIGNFGGPTPALPPTAINASIQLVLDAVEVLAEKSIKFQTKHAIWKNNYTNPNGGFYINSKWNHLN